MSDLCGVVTPTGPCTMQKGHSAQFHRHRVYDKTYWLIKVGKKVIANGEARVPLQYAISDALGKHDKIVIEVERVKADESDS